MGVLLFHVDVKYLAFGDWVSSIHLISKAMVLKLWSLNHQHLHHLKTCSKCTFSGLVSDCRSVTYALISPPGDSDASEILRTTALTLQFKVWSTISRNTWAIFSNARPQGAESSPTV